LSFLAEYAAASPALPPDEQTIRSHPLFTA